MKYIFGAVRHIKIFEPPFQKLPDGVVLIGNMSDFYDLVKNADGQIVVKNMEEFENEVIADSPEHLQLIIKEIQQPWIGNENEFILPRTPENLEWFKQYTSRYKNDNDYNLSFWVNFAFREFDIHWRV